MSLAGMFPHTVTTAPASTSSVGTKGDPVFGAQVTIAAAVEKCRRQVKTRDGRDVRTTHRMATETVVGERDRFWLPAITPGELADDPTKVTQARTPVSV